MTTSESLKAAVIGSPIGHSLSPAIFETISKQIGLKNFKYSAHEVRPGDLILFLDKVRKDHIGFNVTLPHKQVIVGELDHLSPEVEAIGAVNVVKVIGEELKGFNTDWIGISKTIEEQGADVYGKTCLVIGAGGAARAACFALGKLGAKQVWIKNRNRYNAELLSVEMGERIQKTKYAVLESAQVSGENPISLVVNATSVGMKSNFEYSNSEIEQAFGFLNQIHFASDALAFDLIYNPRQTPFLNLAKSLRLRTVGGLDMLVYQALATWEIWFGVNSVLSSFKPKLMTHLKVMLEGANALKKAVFLTGFMGSGKSAVGAVLARKLGWEFLDTDKIIEAQTGFSISKLFETEGEAFFREIERKTISDLSERRNTVISLGGGALMNAESLKTVLEKGILVFLNASPESIRERLAPNANKRPLIAGLSPEEQNKKIETLLKERLPVYNRAGIKIKTDGLKKEEISDLIFEQIKSEVE